MSVPGPAGLGLALALSLPAVALAQPRLLPVDEAARHPDFFTFRGHLQGAIARRDTAAVLAVVDPHVRNHFGDDQGIETFVARWRLSDPASTLWDELGSALALGGSFEGDDAFEAPYVHSRWPDEHDAFEHVAVVGSKVRVREAPDPGSRVLAQVDFAILRLARGREEPGPQGRDWTRVRLPDGRTGHVASRLVRSPVGYRAIFSRKGPSWRLMAFVAGD